MSRNGIDLLAAGVRSFISRSVEAAAIADDAALPERARFRAEGAAWAFACVAEEIGKALVAISEERAKAAKPAARAGGYV